MSDIEESTRAKTMHEIILSNGAHALKMHRFAWHTEADHASRNGHIVMVKSNDDSQVELYDLEIEDCFIIPMSDYLLCCTTNWLLNQSSKINDPEAFERQTKMVRKAYLACGLDV